MTRLPTLFVSHGAPTFALQPGQAGPQLARLGRALQCPRAVLVVSPHWMTRDVVVSSAPRPQTVHDFGGFPQALCALQYPASGHPELAQAAASLLTQAGHRVTLDPQRGLDHGAWVLLLHLFPLADVPVFQVSMPATLDPESAWQLGEVLSPLSEQGVLIVGSGSRTPVAPVRRSSCRRARQHVARRHHPRHLVDGFVSVRCAGLAGTHACFTS